MKICKVPLRHRDRKSDPGGSTVKADASSLPGAIAKATREFVKRLDRKQRFDMNKNGLEVKAMYLGEAKVIMDEIKERTGGMDESLEPIKGAC